METDRDQIVIVLRNSAHPFQVHGPCVVKLEAGPNSRVVATGRDRVHVAFTRQQLVVFAGAMARAYPRLRLGQTIPEGDPNSNYVPGASGRPFLIALRNESVRIGIEIAEGVTHPVVELTAKPQSRVRRVGRVISWMPSWTEAAVLHAEFGIIGAAHTEQQ